MKKIIVPDGMLKAMNSAFDNGRRTTSLLGEAALLWLSENPVVPTHDQFDAMRGTYRDICAEWQRRMFLAPEPEVPEEVKDLLWDGQTGEDEEHNRKIIEAFNRRGQKSR